MNTKLEPKRILISRTDSIGDVMLTFPMCAWLKEKYSSCEIFFLGKSYTQAIIESFSAIDHFVDINELEDKPVLEKVQFLRALKLDAFIHVFPDKILASLAKRAKIPHRVGTSHRAYHLLTCNHRINFSRKNSILHEAQLNFKLLKPFGCNKIPTWEELNVYTSCFKAPTVELPLALKTFLSRNDKQVILHPKSQGSAMEWGLDNFNELAKKFIALGYGVIFTGTEKEGEMFRHSLPASTEVFDSTGSLSLPQLICLIQKTDVLVACSTGPLHIAGFLNKRTIGLFSPRRPIHPGRWRPLGTLSVALVYDEACPVCKKKKVCNCIHNITPERVMDAI
jgi:heptosyltransferase III